MFFVSSLKILEFVFVDNFEQISNFHFQDILVNKLPVAMMGPTLVEEPRSVDEYIATMFGPAVIPPKPAVEESEHDELLVEVSEYFLKYVIVTLPLCCVNTY